jgi:hypothetical protein
MANPCARISTSTGATSRYTALRFPSVAPIMFDPEKEIEDEKRRQKHIDRIAWKAEAAQRQSKNNLGR